MMAPLLTSTAQNNPPGRISQLLPTVKCSNCNKPVPLDELGDHICASPPPVPTLPKPTVSPAAVASLLPPHLQNRLASPTSLSPKRTPSPNDTRFGPVPYRVQEDLQPSFSSPERLKINTTTSTSAPYPTRSSPLARSAPDRVDTSSPAGGPRLGQPSPMSNSSSPLRTRPPNDFRARANSNAAPSTSISTPSPPTTARPLPSTQAPNIQYHVRFNQPREPVQHIPPRIAPSPQISERDIDTKTGGEAGMAGVGRRGFAAAARAAMFTAPLDRPFGSQSRRDNSSYPNPDFTPHSNETPPLSPGSGYSSHSPGVSPYPQSPVGQQGLPSPDRSNFKPLSQPSHSKASSVDKSGLPSSPKSLRMPFERSTNQSPVVGGPRNASLPPTTDTSESHTPVTAKQAPFPARSRDSESAFSASAYSQSQSARSRSQSTSTNGSRQNTPRHTRAPSAASGSESEYGGLAYADSSDNEDEDLPADTKNTRGKANPPPPLRLGSSSLLRSRSTSSTSHVRFPSESTRSGQSVRPGHRRDQSTSSLSSISSDVDDARKSNSAAVAHALGLSQSSPSSYGRLGGPGVGRGGRSASGSSSGGRSGYSRGGRTTSGSSNAGVMERELKTLLEGATPALPADERRFGLTKSKSMKRTFGAGGDGSGTSTTGDIKVPLTAMNPGMSTTISGSQEERRPGIAPLQPPGSMKVSSEASLRPLKERKEKMKKPKTCLKCEDQIIDGRWVEVDNGGVLCVTCWKNMYLPKCRRCNLPIEKQAVSSSDGQLKGKYHRDCFNCHICHAPFPDKSFYVFDGKPLCAYHYHEANDSLCAAARCGQPIEGPCAVSHTGDRYHPEHMTCEYPGNQPCNKKLEEYWEVDGRMLCEHHAHASKVGDDDEDGEEEWVQSSKALKRVTRYIDLAGSSGGSGLR